MNYKNAINAFQTEYHTFCLINKVNEVLLDEKEIFYFISKAYSELSFTNRIIEKSTTVRLIQGQYEYTTGTGTSNIPEALYDVISVKIFEGTANEVKLEKIEIDQMPEGYRESGVPSKWSLFEQNTGKILVINTSPDQSYSSSNNYILKIYYYQQVWLYFGSAENTYTGLDFTSATYGGSFLNNPVWDNLIIQKALISVIPANFKTQHLLMIDKMQKDLENKIPIKSGSDLRPQYGAVSE